MHDFTSGKITAVEFPIPFHPSPSGPFLELFAREEHHNAYFTMVGYTPLVGGEQCVALFTVRSMKQLVYGYPNEEAFWNDPREGIPPSERGLDHGVNEIVGSTWMDELSAYNQASYGVGLPWTPRHFFVGAKDVSAQFLAEDIELEIFTDEPGLQSPSIRARAEALRRLYPHTKITASSNTPQAAYMFQRDFRDLGLDDLFEALGVLTDDRSPMQLVGSRKVWDFALFLSGLVAGQTPEVGASNRTDYHYFGEWLVKRYGFPSGYGWFTCIGRAAEESKEDEWVLFRELWAEFRERSHAE